MWVKEGSLKLNIDERTPATSVGEMRSFTVECDKTKNVWASMFTRNTHSSVSGVETKDCTVTSKSHVAEVGIFCTPVRPSHKFDKSLQDAFENRKDVRCKIQQGKKNQKF